MQVSSLESTTEKRGTITIYFDGQKVSAAAKEYKQLPKAELKNLDFCSIDLDLFDAKEGVNNSKPRDRLLSGTKNLDDQTYNAEYVRLLALNGQDIRYASFDFNGENFKFNSDSEGNFQAVYFTDSNGKVQSDIEPMLLFEYEDKEFSEVSKILEVLFEAYNIIYQHIYAELGIYVFDIIEHSRLNLRNNHANFFLDVALHNPERLTINSILKNMANHYPDSHQRALFIDAFAELFKNVLTEAERYLGTRLAAQTADRIRLESTNIMRFAQESDLKMRLLGVLNKISR